MVASVQWGGALNELEGQIARRMVAGELLNVNSIGGLDSNGLWKTRAEDGGGSDETAGIHLVRII